MLKLRKYKEILDIQRITLSLTSLMYQKRKGNMFKLGFSKLQYKRSYKEKLSIM